MLNLAERVKLEFSRRAESLRLSRMLSAEFQRLRYAKQFREEEHPRDEDGEFTTKGRQRKVKRTPGKATPPPREKKDSIKSARAKAAYNPSTKAKQDASEALEHEAARILKLVKSGDNLAMDLTSPDGMVGVEIKMVHDGKDDKVHMRKDSRQRKEAWIAERKGRRAYTVIIDNRDQYDGGKHRDKYSGNKVYWKHGVGAFRFKGMNSASNLAEVKKAIGL